MWLANLTALQVEHVERVLESLRQLGHVATFAAGPLRGLGWVDPIERLRSRCGSLVVDACLKASAGRDPAPPAYLMPVWPFDHEIDGSPASTAQFIGLDLTVTTSPSPDEEVGVTLPGRAGLWLIHARPMF